MRKNNTKDKIYDFIEQYYAKNGIPPSIREICAGVGLKSTGTVKVHLDRLFEEGRITQEPNKSRSAMPAGLARSIQVPLLGNVAAGMPILATENFEGTVTFFPGKKKYEKKDLFGLTIKGESMKNAGILNGDTVIVKITPVAENGDIVIALIGDEATCKRFYRNGNSFILKAENPDYPDIIPGNAKILGRVISVIRNYY